MIDWITTELGAWSWWILGLIFLILEIISPGVFFLWIGLAAVLVGTMALIFPIAWQIQIVAFAVLALVFAIIGRKIYARFGTNPENRTLNQRSQQYVGRSYTLADAMDGGEGRLKIGDTFWLVRGSEDLVAGSKVMVTGSEGTVLIVKKV